ncbi:MAG: hypothetical protein WC869_11090 [Phycisphaerae bacterium]|jgi:hypothetical protein
MSDLDKVSAGQPIRIGARFFNDVKDMVRDYRNNRVGFGATSKAGGAPGGTILVRNDSGETRQRFDILGVTDTLYTVAQNPDTYKNRPAVKGLVPTTSAHTGRFVVLLQPLLAGDIGQACAVGVVPVQINVVSEAHTFAEVTNSQCGYLTSGTSGSAVILAKDSGTGTKWAIVKIVGGSGGGSAGASVFPAKIVSSVSGAAYTVREQSCTGVGTFGDKTGTSNVLAHNLAELSLGPGGAVAVGAIVLATAITDTGVTTRYIFDHPVYAKYLD